MFVEVPAISAGGGLHPCVRGINKKVRHKMRFQREKKNVSNWLLKQQKHCSILMVFWSLPPNTSLSSINASKSISASQSISRNWKGINCNTIMYGNKRENDSISMSSIYKKKKIQCLHCKLQTQCKESKSALKPGKLSNLRSYLNSDIQTKTSYIMNPIHPSI